MTEDGQLREVRRTLSGGDPEHFPEWFTGQLWVDGRWHRVVRGHERRFPAILDSAVVAAACVAVIIFFYVSLSMLP